MFGGGSPGSTASAPHVQFPAPHFQELVKSSLLSKELLQSFCMKSTFLLFPEGAVWSTTVIGQHYFFRRVLCRRPSGCSTTRKIPTDTPSVMPRNATNRYACDETGSHKPEAEQNTNELELVLLSRCHSEKGQGKT